MNFARFELFLLVWLEKEKKGVKVIELECKFWRNQVVKVCQSVKCVPKLDVGLIL